MTTATTLTLAPADKVALDRLAAALRDLRRAFAPWLAAFPPQERQ